MDCTSTLPGPIYATPRLLAIKRLSSKFCGLLDRGPRIPDLTLHASIPLYHTVARPVVPPAPATGSRLAPGSATDTSSPPSGRAATARPAFRFPLAWAFRPSHTPSEPRYGFPNPRSAAHSGA